MKIESTFLGISTRLESEQILLTNKILRYGCFINIFLKKPKQI